MSFLAIRVPTCSDDDLLWRIDGRMEDYNTAESAATELMKGTKRRD
jgi:hypothetical protein